ncbi:MAG: extracellular solute-binding protein [Oscillospiraceae bacterium]|nr:extracellular solute-binding protein [Oscillospiraceae bacterium]
MKKILALALAFLMVFAVVGCEKPPVEPEAKDITIKVWVSQDDQDITRELADKFAADYPDNVTFEFGVVGEPDAIATYSEDPDAAADVFTLPHDQLLAFVQAGGLYAIDSPRADDIIARNGDGSIVAATLDGKLYAFPSTADNGYFLYYDKSVLSEDDVKSLDKILEVCDEAGKKMFMNLDGNAWYVASFFFSAGCTLSLTDDGKQVCGWNDAKGLAAAEAMKAFCAHPAYLNGDDAVLTGGMGGTIAAGVSGTWNAEAIIEALGDNYAACKLPTFTMDGKQVQMSSFGGYKLFGVNSLIDDEDKLAAALAFADFLTNEDSQLARFEARGYGPSNINAANAPAVKANIALAALAEQSAFATPQKDINNDTFWGAVGAFGTAMVNQDKTDLQELLDIMVEQVEA